MGSFLRILCRSARVRQKLYAMLTKLESTGASWDVLFLEECREMHAHGPDLDCRAPYVDAIGNTAGILDIGGDDEGPPMCVPSGVRAYAVGHQGAKRLAEGAVPIRWAIDVYIGEMIYEQKLRHSARCRHSRDCTGALPGQTQRRARVSHEIEDGRGRIHSGPQGRLPELRFHLRTALWAVAGGVARE